MVIKHYGHETLSVKDGQLHGVKEGLLSVSINFVGVKNKRVRKKDSPNNGCSI